MSDPVYIRDGYTRPFFIAPVAGLHGGLQGEFRPLISDERDEIRHRFRRDDNAPAKINPVAWATIAKQIVKWDAKVDGGAVPVEAKTVRRLQSELADKLFLVVMGMRPSDPIPGGEDAGEETGGGYLDGLAIEEADAKNSPAASA